MKIHITTIIIITFSIIANSQSISIGYGTIHTHTNQKVKMVSSEEAFQHTDEQFTITYEHQIKNTRFSIFGAYSAFDGHTWIKFREGSVIAFGGFPILGVGFSGVNITKYEIGGSYSCFNLNKSIFLRPFFSLGIQLSHKNEWEFWNDIQPINGPDYQELQPILIDSYNTTQIVPALGIKTGVMLWKRIELGLTVQGVLGFKSFQNMYFKYSYNGIPQETAVFEANGTGIYTALSIGYRFVKVKTK